jgi:hypothetical protein
MPGYKCPRCDRYGMEWDGRAKILMCYWQSCSHVIRIQEYDRIPTEEQILEAIEQETVK